MSSASLLQCPFVFWPESKCYQEHYGRLYTDPFDENINPTPSGSILNLFHLGATIFCHHTYSFWVRQFFANIRFILYFLILPLIVKVSLAIFWQTQKE